MFWHRLIHSAAAFDGGGIPLSDRDVLGFELHALASHAPDSVPDSDFRGPVCRAAFRSIYRRCAFNRRIHRCRHLDRSPAAATDCPDTAVASTC